MILMMMTIQNKAVQGSGDACVSDYWERHDEDSAWYRIHVEVRKKFFGTTNEDLPPGGPSHEELDTVRVTHMRGLVTMLPIIGISRVVFGLA